MEGRQQTRGPILGGEGEVKMETCLGLKQCNEKLSVIMVLNISMHILSFQLNFPYILQKDGIKFPNFEY